MESLLQDMRYGVRMLLKRPGFTVIAVLTLALGIGATTAVFSVVNAVVLRPLPFADADRLVGLRETLPDDPSIPLAYRTYAEWRDRNTVFEQVAAMVEWNANLETGGEPVLLEGMRVTSSYFAVMGLKPALGRTFAPEEDQPGAARVVVLSYGVWQGRFGGDPAIVGRGVQINGQDFAVVGVMPPAQGDRAVGWLDIWTPLGANDQRARLNYGRYLLANARLRPGVTVAQARAELERLMTMLKREFPETHGKDYGVDVRPLKDFVVPRATQTALYILLGAVGCVLLITCANVASLLLARAATRQREIAVRAALGASRRRIVRQLLTESVLLAALGAGLGLLVALWLTDLLLALNPEALPRLAGVALDARVLAFTLVLCVLTAIGFGLAPALGATKVNVGEVLKREGRAAGQSVRQRRLHGWLVVGQLALAVVLLAGAGLLIKSFVRLQAVEPGFALDHVLTMEVNLPFQNYQPERRVQFYQQALERLRALPGVTTAAATQSLPLRPTYLTDSVFIEGQPVPPRGQEPQVRGTSVTADYFRALDMRLVRGRAFTEQETWQPSSVIVINEAFARRFFPGQDPVGKRVKAGRDDDTAWSRAHAGAPWPTVVGVVADTTQSSFDIQTIEEMFYPYVNTTEPPVVRMNFVLRTKTEPAALAAAARDALRQVDPSLSLTHVLTMRQLADRTLLEPRFNLLVLGVFASVALVLAAVGIFGLMSHTVVGRTHEFAVRMALGAQAGEVRRLVLGQGLRLVFYGLATGLLAACVATRVLASMLYGVQPTDPLTFVVVSALLASVALLACYVPARRATRVDPMVALRYE